MSRLLFAVLLAIAVFQLVSGDAATDHCDNESLAVEIGDNPILRALQKGSSIRRCSMAITSEYLWTARVFWNEIACIEVVNKQSASLSARLLPTLKHIVRDYVTKVLAPGVADYSCNIRKLLDFIQYTNITGPQPYEFLLSELKYYPELIYERDNLVFELGLEIKTKFGADSAAFMALPTVVQNILSSKPIRVQNFATKKYLSYKEFDNESEAHMNAVTLESDSEESTVWTPVSELDDLFTPEAIPSYYPVYFMQLTSAVKCSQPDCVSLLSESQAPRGMAIITNGYYLFYKLDTPSMSYSLQLASDNTVIIKRSYPGNLYVPMALTDSISGGLRFLPQKFYNTYKDSVPVTEFLRLDNAKEAGSRTEEEKENDLLRNQWTVSLA